MSAPNFKLILTVAAAVTAVALMAAGTAFAAGGNDSNIDQIGDHNNASVDQSNGTGELSAVTQTSDSNGAQVIQYGAGDQSTISQDTSGASSYTSNTRNIVDDFPARDAPAISRLCDPASSSCMTSS